jgi:uncharacterized protein YbjT (DUF2867 family)/uncharacterized protein YndB with AHSA1/START domain
MENRHVLVTGATGYVGGRLVPELLKNGHKVRCLVRTPEKLEGLDWRNNVEVVKGDLSDESALSTALEGIDCAYYLVHSMAASAPGQFQKRDMKIARSFRQAAQQAGVKRIIYLGGLGDESDPNLSPHLQSRHDVGEVLRDGTVAVTELRAAVIIGSGSASFEMLRNLVEMLPVMITPKWLRTRCQPIAIRDVLFYLVNALQLEDETRTIEIGGPDVLEYREMMQTYARLAHLKKRIIITLPLLTPRLSSHWIGLVTPLPTSLAKPLVLGLENEVVVTDHSAEQLMPHKCLSFEHSIALAIEHTRDLEVTTRWADADLSWRSPADPMPSDPEWSGGVVLDDTQTVTTEASPHAVFRAVTGIGGKRGWLVTDKLWEIRGLMDKLVGGVGMRRGRRHPDDLRIGDALDFWRVEALVPDTLLRLRAEMRLPGRAWLEWTISEEDGKTQLTQKARYQPRGLAGRLYWYSLLPFHAIIFKGLAAALVKEAEGYVAD